VSDAVDVVVVGTLNLDTTVRVVHLPRPGESVRGDLALVSPGGKGANQAVAAARLGARTTLVGCVGDDPAGDAVLAALTREPRLDLRGVTRVAGPTGTVTVTVADDGANAVVSGRGANDALTEDLVHRHGAAIARASVVVVQLGIPVGAACAALEIARSVGTLTVVDPSPAAAATDALLRLADVCTPNEPEAEALTRVSVADDDGVRRAASALLARCGGAVVLTLGSRGAYVATGARAATFVPAVPVTVVDPTGAGDACNGALAAALAAGATLDAAVAAGVAAGALAVTRLGALASLPTTAELDRAADR
jgi:ribokinase